MQNNIPCSPTSFHSIVKRISVEKCCHLSWHCGSTNDLALCASLSPTAEARSACNAHQTFASPAFCPAFHLFPYTALPGRHSSDCRCFDWNQFGCKSWSGGSWKLQRTRLIPFNPRWISDIRKHFIFILAFNLQTFFKNEDILTALRPWCTFHNWLDSLSHLFPCRSSFYSQLILTELLSIYLICQSRCWSTKTNNQLFPILNWQQQCQLVKYQNHNHQGHQ